MKLYNRLSKTSDNVLHKTKVSKPSMLRRCWLTFQGIPQRCCGSRSSPSSDSWSDSALPLRGSGSWRTSGTWVRRLYPARPPRHSLSYPGRTAHKTTRPAPGSRSGTCRCQRTGGAAAGRTGTETVCWWAAWGGQRSRSLRASPSGPRGCWAASVRRRRRRRCGRGSASRRAGTGPGRRSRYRTACPRPGGPRSLWSPHLSPCSAHTE